MQESYDKLVEELIRAPVNSFQYRLIISHPWIMEDPFLQILQKRRRAYLKKREYQRVQKLSRVMFLLESSRKTNPERTLFGRSLLDEEKNFLAKPLNSDAFSTVSELDLLAWRGEWDEIVKRLLILLTEGSGAQDPILRTELFRRLASACKNSQKNETVTNLESALEYLDTGLRQRGDKIFPVEKARILECRGIVFLELGYELGSNTFREQVQCYNEALKVFTPEFFPEGWGSLNMNIGNAYFNRIDGNRVRNLELAISKFKSIKKIFSMTSYPFTRMILDMNLGNVYILRLHGDPADNLETALKYYRASLHRRHRNWYPYMRAFLLNNMAGLYRSRIRGDKGENIESGIDCCNEAIEICRQNEYVYEGVRAKSNKGHLFIYRSKGDRKKNIEEAISLLKESSKELTYDSYPLGWANLNEGLAEAYLVRIRGNPEENLASCLAHCEAARRIFDKDTNPSRWAWIRYLEGAANLVLGSEAGNREQLVEAESLFGEALKVLNPYSLSSRCTDAALGLVKTRMKLGNWEGAVEAAEAGRKANRLKLIEATSVPGRASEFEGSAEIFFLAAAAELRAGKPVGALKWLEEGRLKEVNTALARDRAMFRKDLKRNDRREYAALIDQLRLAEWRQRTADSENAFTEASRNAKRISGNIETVRKRVQEYIPDFLVERTIDQDTIIRLAAETDAVYLVFIVTDLGTGIILFTRGRSSPVIQVFSRERCTKEYLESLAARWNASVARLRSSGFSPSLQTRNTWRNDLDLLGRELYQELFSEAYDWIRENCNPDVELILVPHLSLHQLPLHLARFDTNDGPRYLVEERCLRFRPGLSIFEDADFDRNAVLSTDRTGEAEVDQDALVISDSSGNLFWSENEAESVAKSIPGKVNLLKGEEATPEAVRRSLKEATLLHCSCHALFDPALPWNSALLLASGEKTGDTSRGTTGLSAGTPENPRNRNRYRMVPLSEIFPKMECRRAELVVLSACESGRVQSGVEADEFVGLAGGFLGIGARTVIASVWPVDDRTTTVLMSSFYRNLFEENLSVSRALWHAQLELCEKRRWSNPFFWGSFLVYGG